MVLEEGKVQDYINTVNEQDIPLITVEILEAVVKRGSTSSSPGSDLVTYDLMKLFGARTLQALVHLYNLSIKQGSFYTEWKKAKIYALKKPSGGYRGISLLSVLGKTLEKIVYFHLRQAIKIPEEQFAFKGTDLALSRFFGWLKERPLEVHYCVFLDVVKAFDRVSHTKLLEILMNEQVPPWIVRWIKSFLQDRSARIGNFSYSLVNGVPQGCVLSPMLFCVYIKYLLLDIDSSVFRQGYADDLVFGSRSGPGSINKLQRTLNSIHQRATSLGVQFDIGVKKSAAMWISLNKNIRKPSKPLLKLGGKFIPWTSTYKYLGVLLDNRLTMKEEVTKRIKDGAKRNLLIFRLKTCTTRTLRSLWIGYCRSAVTYGLKHYWFHLSQALQDKISAFFTVSAKKIVGIPPWSKNVISLQLAAIDSAEVFVGNTLMSRTILRRTKPKPVGLSFSKLFEDARQAEMVYARWTTGFLYTMQIKNKFAKYPRLDGSHCRFGCAVEETRQHLLLECIHLAGARQDFLDSVQKIIGIHPTTIEEALGVRVKSQSRKGRIARILNKFLQSTDLHL